MSFGPYCYFNNGLSFRAVSADYVPVSGEVVFQTVPTVAQLTAAFTGYAAAVAAQQAANAASIARQAANAAIAAGLQVQSTSHSNLNATYSIDAPAQANINAVITYILVNGNFPGGGTVMPWSDNGGGIHIFPDVATFKLFATAVANYTSAVLLYGDSGGAVGSLPSQPVVIA